MDYVTVFYLIKAAAYRFFVYTTACNFLPLHQPTLRCFDTGDPLSSKFAPRRMIRKMERLVLGPPEREGGMDAVALEAGRMEVLNSHLPVSMQRLDQEK